MHLSKYLSLPGKTQQGLAAKIGGGVSQGLVFQWLKWLESNGAKGTRVTPERAVQIEAATEGLVRCEDLLPALDWRRDNRNRVTGYLVDVTDRQPVVDIPPNKRSRKPLSAARVG